MADLVINGQTPGPCGCCGEVVPRVCQCKSGTATLIACDDLPHSDSRSGSIDAGTLDQAPGVHVIFNWSVALTPHSTDEMFPPFIGRWVYDVAVSASVASGNAVIDEVYVRVGTGGQVPHDGETFDLGQCGQWGWTVDGTQFQLVILYHTPSFSGLTANFPAIPGEDTGPVFQIPKWPGIETLGINVQEIWDDEEMPFDEDPDCNADMFIGYPNDSGEFDYHMCQYKFTFDGLTIGKFYCIKIEWEWQVPGSDEWDTFSTIYLLIEAEATSEMTDWQWPFGGGSIYDFGTATKWRLKETTITELEEGEFSCPPDECADVDCEECIEDCEGEEPSELCENCCC